MKLPKIPIDYSKIDSGEAPFDGLPVIGHNIHTGHIVVVAYSPYGDTADGVWLNENDDCPRAIDYITHYTPMPEFEVKGGA